MSNQKQKKRKKSYFAGECAIVTGASSGIGKEISRILVRDFGMMVFGVSRNLEKLERIKAEIESENPFGGSFVPYALDVTDIESIFDLRSHINTHCLNLRLVISNAGQMLPITEFSRENEVQEKGMTNTNLIGAMNMARVFIPDLRHSPVKVGFVFVGSIAGIVPVPGCAAYSASKAGVKNFAESVIAENKKRKLYIGHMMPGMTNTNLFAKSGQDLPDWVRKYMTSASKMAEMIVNKARKRKKRCVLGADAKIMRMCYRLNPSGFPRLMRRVLEKAGIYH
ncbi:MAG: SDR family NAD(P)-dependent oxidoreductase [Clostridia bacterium]|nr:SDR family NAD(P)-dependent oxidoreductase [Clostridia bacterium]